VEVLHEAFEMKYWLSFLLCISIYSVWGQDEIWIKPNKGQWDQRIEYLIKIPGGELFLEKNGFTYALNNYAEVRGDHHHDSEGSHEHELRGHAVKTNFLGSNPNPVFEQIEPSPFYENYFLGNDSSKWVSNSHAYHQVNYLSLYPNLDLHLYEANATLKYDVVVHPGGNPSDFKVQYTGHDNLRIVDDRLIIETSLGEIIEGKPKAYQIIDGKETEVACFYNLDGNIMHFILPDGYNENYDLVIDPDLTFSTFTGSSADNWGMTACPDVNKNLIAAGIVFSSGYPVSAGAFDMTFTGGPVDIGITKFNATGSGIIFSTYLGGFGSETPHSLIVNDANELHVFGATSSQNFPIGAGAFQTIHNGGTTETVDGILFSGGTDIFITKFSAGGNSILGGTYLGGSGNDGISLGSTIAFNYGDQLRGEVMVDDANFIYITSSTSSSNFPINGGFDASLGGTQDAVVAKFNSNLTSLLWSTYVGGTSLESGNSVQLASNGDIFVCGGTTSTNFPSTTGQLNPTFKGGTTDGYVIKFPAPTYANPTATYLGTNDYDQAYFLQLDPDDYVYVYGQTKGPYTVSPGRYVNPNSGQFIHKLSNNLVTSEWSSVFGRGSGNEEISPTAFLVSDCYEIYIAGWGGVTNSANAPNSTTSGFPVTSDAYMSTTNGNNFYLALFTKDMVALKYATFMGSVTGSNDHVDGGTSRFDKSGGVYHAVCAACGGNSNGFPTTPGVFSPTNNSNNCNMAAFLFELAKIEAVLGTGTPVICIPDPVIFDNQSENGNSYFWDFGDGGTSTAFEPTHYYTTPGIYNVMLVVEDTSGCYDPDTAYVEVEIQALIAEAGALSDTICPGESVQLYALGGSSYVWGPGSVLNDSTIATPIATIWEETTFTVFVDSDCGTSELEVTVYVFGADATASPDTAICVGGSAQLMAGGGDAYTWTPSATLNDPTIPDPVATPPITTFYVVEIITPEGCHIFDTTNVIVDQDIPYPNLIDEVTICKGDQIQIAAGGATSYIWSPNYNISATNVYNPFVFPDVDTSYAVSFTNACGTTHDTVDVFVIEVDGFVNPDTIICPEGQAVLWASGGVSYSWKPSGSLSDPNESSTIANPTTPTHYTVTITDIYGCSQTLTTFVDLYESPIITVSPEVYAIQGDTVGIWAEGEGTIIWSPAAYTYCVECFQNYVYPPNEMIYTATLIDMNGCTASGIVPIYYDPLIYVPNAFTPNGDQWNHYFQAITNNIETFEMLIFNRWGEVVYSTTSVIHSWDGTYHGYLVPDDVYVWQIKYTDLKGNENLLRGHVTVLR
jgi:gliding motility-associated-like protein